MTYKKVRSKENSIKKGEEREKHHSAAKAACVELSCYGKHNEEAGGCHGIVDQNAQEAGHGEAEKIGRRCEQERKQNKQAVLRKGNAERTLYGIGRYDGGHSEEKQGNRYANDAGI